MATIEKPRVKSTMADVARLAGVSKKTVSRVLNKEAYVKAETFESVMKAMSELDYRPSLSARGLATNRSFLIGLLFDKPSPGYILNVQNGVWEALHHEDYSLMVQPLSRYKKEEAIDSIRDMVLQANIDGFVLTPPVSEMEEVMAMLTELDKPFVRIAPAKHEASKNCVLCDDFGASREMTEHLINLGHTRIGFIKGDPIHGVTSVRLSGYKQALANANIAFEDALVQQGFFNFESGQGCAATLMALENPPTAIFASNDEMAAGAMAYLHSREIKIPEDVSVAGYDDTPISSQVWPTMTTVRQPATDMATYATQRLLKTIEKSKPKLEDRAFKCTIIHRNSIAPAKKV